MAQTWIALMRGVNVGGHAKLPMAAFRDLLSGLGFGDVRTYIQSGNAVFAADGAADDLARRITEAVEAEFGFERLCVVLTAEQLGEAIDQNPFAQHTDDPKTVHLMFLKGAVQFDADAFNALCTNGEIGVLKNNVLYLLTPNGFGRSKAVEKLGTVLTAQGLTARNLNSCRNIAALAQAQA